MFKVRWVVTLVVLSTLLGSVLAQDLSAEAATALATGETAMQVALSRYEQHYPDRPLWREAIRYGQEARGLEPTRPEPLRFLAEAYSRTGWYGPAWQTWNDYLALGGNLDPAAVPLFTQVGGELAYDRYREDRVEDALAIYQRVSDIVPYDKEAFVWAGRLLLELNRAADALPYWQTVVERDSTDERAQHFLQLTQNEVQWGRDAARTYQEGLAHYEKGNLSDAADKFIQASELSEDFSDAYVWAGRSLLELGRPAQAVPYWRTLTQRDSADARASYFLQLAEDQAQWGAEVANAFREGVRAYEAEDLSAAAAAFDKATQLREDYAEAWAWRGRVAFETEAFGSAQTFYETAAALQASNETYAYFANEAESRAAGE